MDTEKLGPAERIIQALLSYSDHLVHNRPGFVATSPNAVTGVEWKPATHVVKDGQKVVQILSKTGKRTIKTEIGTVESGNEIKSSGRVIGRYQAPGLFPEVAKWVYNQIAEIWKLDNEFAARWASWAFAQENRDMKVVLAAFMIVQSRKGDPVVSDGRVIFQDEDYRDVGEAMMLLYGKNIRDLNPRMLIRIYEFLSLDEIVAVNRELGFGQSQRKAHYGRWKKIVHRWLRYREENPKMMTGLVGAGFKSSVKKLAILSRYKPVNRAFFDSLRWKQVQAKDGHRTFSIGQAVAAADSWEGMSEADVCEKIVREKPNYLRLVGLVPKSVGITRAVMAAAMDAGCISNKELVILTPTLEELGLLEIQVYRERWEEATRKSEDMRAANIAQRVKSMAIQEKLQESADHALQKVVAEAVESLRIYVMVDISGSMQDAIERAKVITTQIVSAFSLDVIHVSVFNTMGREVRIQHASRAGVEHAFRGITCGGGTDYGSAIRALSHHKPGPNEDALFIYIGDEEAPAFAPAVHASGLQPLAFGFVKVGGGTHNEAVRRTARELSIPCFKLDEKTFSDPYAIPATIRNLIAATPVQTALVPARTVQRQNLVDVIMKTEMLKKPSWAC